MTFTRFNHSIFMSLALNVLLVACSSTASKSNDTVAKTSRTPSSFVTSQPGPARPSLGVKSCDEDPTLERPLRLELLSLAVEQAERELEANPNAVFEDAPRARIATFAAGTMDDQTPFVSLDRSCWAQFYEAQTKLTMNDDVGAKEAADAWRACLAATFPQRLEIAQPYFSCFGIATAKASKPKDK